MTRTVSTHWREYWVNMKTQCQMCGSVAPRCHLDGTNRIVTVTCLQPQGLCNVINRLLQLTVHPRVVQQTRAWFLEGRSPLCSHSHLKTKNGTKRWFKWLKCKDTTWLQLCLTIKMESVWGKDWLILFLCPFLTCLMVLLIVVLFELKWLIL